MVALSVMGLSLIHIFLSENKVQVERLENIFHQIGRGQAVVRPLSVTLHEGFVDNDLKLCLYTDHQIFDLSLIHI